jgi:hypothetical protein
MREHSFTCELCGKKKTCKIAGCQGDCTPWCGKCIRLRAYRQKLERRKK